MTSMSAIAAVLVLPFAATPPPVRADRLTETHAVCPAPACLGQIDPRCHTGFGRLAPDAQVDPGLSTRF